MGINVIGLLNISIEDDEYVFNDNLKLISRDFFEKNNIAMPQNVRFYKTFIVSSHDFCTDFSFNQLDEDSQKAMPLYLLLALRLFISDNDIISSEWFYGEDYSSLKEFIKINNDDVIDPFDSDSKNWIESFIINKMAILADNSTLDCVKKLYNNIYETYLSQSLGKDCINIHWLISFTRFQEYYNDVDFGPFVRYIQTSLETLLVDTEDESPFRARLYASLLAYDDYKNRIATFKILTWIYNINNFEKELSLLSDVQIEQKVKMLKQVMARILVRTAGLSTKDIKQSLQNIMFNSPAL